MDRIQASYLHLVSQTSMLEDAVKIVVLSPLLSLADFFLPPFAIQSEVAVQLAIADAEMTIEDKIDILIVCEQLWVMVIESKRAAISLAVGLPQLLAYMLASPHPVQPLYGMITKGGSFIFLKLTQGTAAPHYALYEMRNPGNDLSSVLAVLKHLRELLLSPQHGNCAPHWLVRGMAAEAEATLSSAPGAPFLSPPPWRAACPRPCCAGSSRSRSQDCCRPFRDRRIALPGAGGRPRLPGFPGSTISRQ
jgi:hypothetical protein